jgi:hypothetical protein
MKKLKEMSPPTIRPTFWTLDAYEIFSLDNKVKAQPSTAISWMAITNMKISPQMNSTYI